MVGQASERAVGINGRLLPGCLARSAAAPCHAEPRGTQTRKETNQIKAKASAAANERASEWRRAECVVSCCFVWCSSSARVGIGTTERIDEGRDLIRAWLLGWILGGREDDGHDDECETCAYKPNV